MMLSRRLLLLLPFVALACKQEPTTAPSGLAVTKVTMGGKSFTLEVADTEATRRFGLMRRDSMPEDHGMIFVFKEEEPLGFYMKDTRIPLDILYLDKDGKIVSIKQMKPFDQNTYPSDGPAKFAIELNKGTAEKVGLKAGMTITLPNLAAKD